MSGPLIPPQTQYGAAPTEAFSLFVGQMLTYVYQSNGWTLAFLTPQMSIVPNNQTLTIPLEASKW